jgi:hypothetical protein
VSIHTGGGSTILLGLLALGAVVGWRSRTRIGAHLQKQMVILLALTAVMGVAMSGLVDNYGHLGGAIVGALIGLFDRTLTRLSGRKWFRASCWAVVLGVSAACLGSAIRDDRAESDYRRRVEAAVSRYRRAQSVFGALNQLHYLYALEVSSPEADRRLGSPFDAYAMAELLSKGPRTGEPAKPDPGRSDRSPAQMAGVLDRLDHIREAPWGEAVAADIGRLRDLARRTFEAPPSYEQVYEFATCWRSADQAVVADLARLNAQLVELEAVRKKAR